MTENRTSLELQNKFLCKTVEMNIYINGSAREERGKEAAVLIRHVNEWRKTVTL